MAKRIQKKSAQAQQQSKPRARSKKEASKKKDPFRMALLDPFDESADGARVPDLFSAPTETRTFVQSFNLTADVNGNIDYMGFANPRYPGLSYRGNIIGGGSYVYAANSAVSQNNALPTGAGNDLAGELINYRVVGWGLKLSAIGSMTTTTGVVTMAAVPYAGYVPHAIVIGGQSHTSGNSGTMIDFYGWSGIPTTGDFIDISRLPNMDYSEERTATSLATSPLVFVSRPVDPRAYNFRMSGDMRLGYDTQGQTSTTYITAGNASQADASGWLVPVIGGSGFPANTVALRAEIVYHLEGTPAYSISSMHSGGADPSPVDFQKYVSVLSEVARQPAIKSLAVGALHSFGLSPLAHLIS